MTQLPVEQIHDELVAPFLKGQHKRILLKAPTGSGKSTMVPIMLLDQKLDGIIVVIQPRRMAARLLAKRVASLRSTTLGDEIGYSVRFDQKRSDNTKVIYVTDGIFQNWLARDPQLSGVSCVLFDEFHERRVASDVALAKCLNLQEGNRADLEVIVMSATLDIGDLASYLGDCRQLETSGRTYPVDIEYRNPEIQSNSRQTLGRDQSREGIWDLCYKAAKQAIADTNAGHILIFLPGAYEIRKTIDLLERDSAFRHCDICPLYSALSPKLQDHAVASSDRQKVIVSTNVAETSLTINGVKTVIDSGLARVSEFDANRGIETLHIKPISQAAADQRAGRAGRTAPGKCFRLWSHTSHARRTPFEIPEIQRTDIAELMLKLLVEGEFIETFRWIDPPNEQSVFNARQVLLFLDAIDQSDSPTELGKEMARFPLPPRFSRFLFAGREEGCLAEACFIAAAIQGDSIFSRANKRSLVGRGDYIYKEDTSDFEGEYRAFEAAVSMDFNPKRCGDIGVQGRSAKECSMALKQIQQYVNQSNVIDGKEPVESLKVRFSKRGEAVVKAGVKAFGDRIGRRLSPHSLASKLSDGRRGLLDTDSTAKDAELFIPTEITEIDGRDVVVYFNRCFALSVDLVKSAFSEHIKEVDDVEFEVISRKVVRKKVTQFKGMTISEVAGGNPDPDLASSILAQKIIEGELVINSWDSKVDNWLARLETLRKSMPELELPEFTEEDKFMVVEQFCQKSTSYKEIKNKEFFPVLRSWLSAGQVATLDAYAPTEIQLSNGKKTKVYYQTGQIPWIAMRAQHLFGVEQTPTIANNTIKLNVHICAPNNRPWQITNDLEGFWKTGFEQMRKDLAGRYPKHQWVL